MDWGKLAWVLVPALALVLVVIAVVNRLIEPWPPRRITFSMVRESGAYHAFAKEDVRPARADGFEVEIMTGAGTVETLKRLAGWQAMAGFVQGGTAVTGAPGGLARRRGRGSAAHGRRVRRGTGAEGGP